MLDITTLDTHNTKLKTMSPEKIVEWIIPHSQRPIVTTNFRPFEAALLHACTHVKRDITVVWCDTGYNTYYMYKHAIELSTMLALNLHTYVPKQSAAYRNSLLGGIPDIDDDAHTLFTEQVKLEPFARAMKEHNPDIWITNIRKGQTELRDTLDIISVAHNGIIRVSPFFYWSDAELDVYLQKHNLPNEERYFDPTKGLDNRECGIHNKIK